MASNQANLFIIFSFVGTIIGLLFDLFRISRKVFKTNDIVTYLEDILFWILTGIMSIYSMYRFCDGELRFFMVVGIIFGTIIYMFTISKYIIILFTSLLDLVKKIIVYPVKGIINITKRILFRHIWVICINYRKKFIDFNKKNKKIRGFFKKKENYNSI